MPGTAAHRPYRVGLTGGLGSGKSTVARLLAENGFAVFDADRLVAELYAPRQPGAQAVGRFFGDDVLDPDGRVNHSKLAARVFSNDEARHRLEAEIHPLVRRRFAELAAALPAETPVVVLEATLLVEAGYAPDFDLVITVEADRETRRQRAMARGMGAAEAEARLTAQGNGEVRRAAAGLELRNDGTPDELRVAVTSLAEDLRGRQLHRSMTDLAAFVLVTANPGKLAEARRLLGSDLAAIDLDLPEVQSLDMRAVLEAKADEAWRRTQRPLVVEETGLELDALGGFPGPLVKWMLEAIGPAGIARTAIALGDPHATARCMLLHTDGTRRTFAEGSTRGQMVLPGRGGEGFGWDPVFQPEEEGFTYGELPPSRKDEIGHRGRAWRALRASLIGGESE
ncbi:MAG: dephospho-CoA kinase [Acidobacteriota bacterium]